MKFYLELIFIVLSSIISLYTHGQKTKGSTNCEAVTVFLSSAKASTAFHSESNNVDTFYIIDADSSLTKCGITQWRDKPVKIITEGPLFDNYKSPTYNLYKVTNGRKNIYLFQGCIGAKGYCYMVIHWGYNNLYSQAYFIISKKGLLILNSTENGVF